MTIHSRWVRLILLLLLLLVTVVASLAIGLVQTRRNLAHQNVTIASQAADIKDLSIRLARRDEEILSLKKKMSSAIRHKSYIIPTQIKLPELHPPIAEIAELQLEGDDLVFKIVNIKASSGASASGHLFAVFRKGEVMVSHPAVNLLDGVPVEKNSGFAFSIRNFKPMRIKATDIISDWENVTFYIFDEEDKLRLALPVTREQLEEASP